MVCSVGMKAIFDNIRDIVKEIKFTQKAIEFLYLLDLDVKLKVLLLVHD